MKLADPPFVLPIKMVISGLEIGMFERSEFFRLPCDNHFCRGVAGQHKGCPWVVRELGTQFPDSHSCEIWAVKDLFVMVKKRARSTN